MTRRTSQIINDGNTARLLLVMRRCQSSWQFDKRAFIWCNCYTFFCTFISLSTAVRLSRWPDNVIFIWLKPGPVRAMFHFSLSNRSLCHMQWHLYLRFHARYIYDILMFFWRMLNYSQFVAFFFEKFSSFFVWVLLDTICLKFEMQ